MAVEAGVRTPQRLPRWLGARALFLLALSVSALLSILALWFLAFERVAMRDAALREAELHARLLAEQVDRNFDAADIGLRAAAEALSAGPGADPGVLLAQSVRSLPLLRSMSLLDAEGRVVASSNPGNLAAGPQGRVGDARLRVGAALAGRDLADAKAIGSHAAHQLFVPVNLGDGSRGAPRLLATLNANYFDNAFDLLLKESTLGAALVQLDMRPIAASERLSVALGAPLVVDPKLRSLLGRQDQGRGIGRGPLTPKSAIWAFRATRKAPWLIVVTMPLDVVDAAWRDLALRIGLALLLCLLLLAFLVVLGRRSLRAYEEQRAARRRAQLQWQRELALNARLIDASNSAVYVKDNQGRVAQVNQAWRDLTGLADLQLPADLPAQLDPQDPTCGDGRLLAEGGAVQFDARMETPAGVIDVLVSKAVFRDGEGAVAGLVCGVTNVTIYREVERRSREAATAAQAANDAKTQFIANMSHVLRTPLQSILGFSEIGRERSGEQVRLQLLFERVNVAGHQMLELVEGLLNLADPAQLRSRLAIAPQPLKALLQSVTEELQRDAERRGLSLAIGTGADAGLMVAVDAQAFQRMLGKLVGNAIAFAPPQSLVEIDCQSDGQGTALITVADRGPGIPEAELEAIFQPFVRGTRTDDHAGGAGIGLGVARAIAALFGGRIWASNRDGGGAVFTIALPVPQERI